jgi:hypothetical protein
MNPIGLMLVGLGLIVFIIGFKGDQHKVINAFQGIKGKNAVTAYNPAPFTPATPTTQQTTTTGTQATLL